MSCQKTHLLLALLASFLLMSRSGTAQTRRTAATQELTVQRQDSLSPKRSFLGRVTETPPDVIKLFHDAGMSPQEHTLTDEESRAVRSAFAALPPFHQQVLKQHLKSISFLDNMPNTALTSTLNPKDTFRLYHITFRAAILHQNASEWLTEKERTCFVTDDSSYAVSVQAGFLSALTYVLLHETTHVVDGSLGLLSEDTVAGQRPPNTFRMGFTNGIWRNMTVLNWTLSDSLVFKSRFRYGGKPFPVSQARRVYQGLRQTPFVSLYSTSSRHEDLAEYLTVYHFTHVLKQPFRIVVSQNGKEVMQYEPMQSALGQNRIKLLKRFYTSQG